MDDVILSVRDLRMDFPVRKGLLGRSHSLVKAVDGVSFDVRRGEFYGIVGESGSGKTTAGRCVMRVLDPTSGSVVYTTASGADVDLTTLDRSGLREIWREIRMIFQDPQSSLNPRLPIVEIIGQSLRSYGLASGGDLADEVRRLLSDVGMRPEVLHRYPGAFSGGQRQRIGVARALATRPRLIIADEAVSALDVSIQAQTLNLLQDLQEKYDLTFIFIAHDLAVVEHVCDRIAVMYKGRIVEEAATDTLFGAPLHPYTRMLLDAVPVPDPSRRRKRVRATRAPAQNGDHLAPACSFAPRCPHAREICRSDHPDLRQIGATRVACHFAGELAPQLVPWGAVDTA